MSKENYHTLDLRTLLAVYSELYNELGRVSIEHALEGVCDHHHNAMTEIEKILCNHSINNESLYVGDEYTDYLKQELERAGHTDYIHRLFDPIYMD